MKEFMFFIRKQSDSKKELAADVHEQFLKSCEQYINMLKKEGKLIAAQPIERTGKIISGNESGWKEVPFNESPEVIGGYYHILANNEQEAIEIAKANPEFAFNKNTRIEVRSIKTNEDTTGFTYPSEKK